MIPKRRSDELLLTEEIIAYARDYGRSGYRMIVFGAQLMTWMATAHGITICDDLDRACGSACDARLLISGVSKKAVDEGEAGGDTLEDERHGVAILDAGQVDLHVHHQTERVAEQMALARLYPLSRIETDANSCFSASFDALTIDDGCRGALFSSLQIAASAVESVVDSRPTSVVAPRPIVAVDGAARRNVAG